MNVDALLAPAYHSFNLLAAARSLGGQTFSKEFNIYPHQAALQA